MDELYERLSPRRWAGEHFCKENDTKFMTNLLLKKMNAFGPIRSNFQNLA